MPIGSLLVFSFVYALTGSSTLVAMGHGPIPGVHSDISVPTMRLDVQSETVIKASRV